jgi:hypothetical protein
VTNFLVNPVLTDMQYCDNEITLNAILCAERDTQTHSSNMPGGAQGSSQCQYFDV